MVNTNNRFILVMLWLNRLTLRPLSTTILPYANSFDPDETPSNSVSHPD